MKTTSKYLLLCLLSVGLCASCDTADPGAPAPTKADPAVVILSALANSYEFREGTTDSAAITVDATFRFSEDLIGFGGLQARVSGKWTTGAFELDNKFAGSVARDTFPLFSWATLELTAVDSPGKCMGVRWDFNGDGEYAKIGELSGCCADCFASSEDLIGREIKATLVIAKSSRATANTIAGTSGEIIEIRVEAIRPEIADESLGLSTNESP